MKKFLRFALLSWIVPVLMLSGCGGGGGSASPAPAAPAKTSLSGTVSLPTLNALVAKRTALAALPTVEVRELGGRLVATATVTGSGTTADPFTYTASNLDTGVDYVIKVVSGSQVLKALVDKASLAPSATTVRDVDVIATTAVILAEKKLNVTPGTIGESSSGSITSSAIATLQPVALETAIKTAVNTVQFAPATVTQQATLDLVNLVNVVTATVNSGVNTAQFINGGVTTPVSTTQFTLAEGGGATADASASVTASVAQTTLTSTASSYTPPPANSVAFTSKVYDYQASAAGSPLGGVFVTTVGLTTEITTLTDASGKFTLAGIPQGAAISVRMSKSGYADAYSNTFSLSANLDVSDRPYALWPPARLAAWGNYSGNGAIRSRVVDSANQVSGYIGGAVVSATDKADGTTTYPVKYVDGATGNVSTSLTATDSSGLYVVANVPSGHTVDVTASRFGYTFNTKTFTAHAGSVSQARVVGTAGTGFTAAAGSYGGILYSLDGSINDTFYLTVDSLGKVTGASSDGSVVLSGNLSVSASSAGYAFSGTAVSGTDTTTISGLFNAATGTFSGTATNASESYTWTAAKPPMTFTAATVGGKAYTWSSANSSGTIAYNANGTFTGTDGSSSASGTWSINAAGQLVIKDTVDHTVTTVTLTNVSGSVLTSTDITIDDNNPSGNLSETVTWTATTTGAVSVLW